MKKFKCSCGSTDFNLYQVCQFQLSKKHPPVLNKDGKLEATSTNDLDDDGYFELACNVCGRKYYPDVSYVE